MTEYDERKKQSLKGRKELEMITKRPARFKNEIRNRVVHLKIENILERVFRPNLGYTPNFNKITGVQ